MATVAVNALETPLANTTTYASWDGLVSAVAKDKAKVFLASDFTAGSTVRFDNTSASAVLEVCDGKGRRLGFIQPKHSGLAVLRIVTDSWDFKSEIADLPAFVAVAPAGGVGAAAGAYDTSGNRDTMIALVNAMRTQMINRGWLKAE